MARKRKTDVFLGNLLDSLYTKLPENWEVEKGPNWQLLRRHDWGYVGIKPVMSFKHLPATHVQILYGVKHDSLHYLLKELGDAWDDIDTFQFYTCMPESALVSDYNVVDFGALADELLREDELNRLLTLLDNFADLRNIRSTIEGPEPALDPNESGMVAIDVVLDDLEHLRRHHDSLSRRHLGRKAIRDGLDQLDISW